MEKPGKSEAGNAGSILEWFELPFLDIMVSTEENKSLFQNWETNSHFNIFGFLDHSDPHGILFCPHFYLLCNA